MAVTVDPLAETRQETSNLEVTAYYKAHYLVMFLQVVSNVLAIPTPVLPSSSGRFADHSSFA